MPVGVIVAVVCGSLLLGAVVIGGFAYAVVR